jgi:voltage-gated potassium channel
MLGRLQKVRGRLGRADELTPEQHAARERWEHRWNLPILLAAFIPLFVTSPNSRAVAVAVGVSSWLVFLIDLVVQRRIVPDYLHRAIGRFDLAIVIVTFPVYLIPEVNSYSAILLLARLGRVARVLMATKGLRRLAERLGKVALIAAVVVVLCSLSAYEAEHPTNPGFATFGDALWWGIVTLTTVGYGDIVPKTTAGRLSGVAIMLTGVAVLGVLAGSLASMFGIDSDKDDAAASPGREHAVADGGTERSVEDDLASLQSQLVTVQRGFSDLAEHIRSLSSSAGTQ